MNKVSGKIVLRGTDVGIPHLLVTAYDKNSGTPPPSHGPPLNAGAPPAHGDAELNWNRLGSSITGAGGVFGLEYEHIANAGGQQLRPELVLVVSSPEESGTTPQEQPVRIAAVARRNAASVESFLIVVDEARLSAAGVRIPKDGEDIDELIKQRRAAAQRQEKLQGESRRLLVERLEKRRHFEKISEANLQKFLSSLSALPEERRNLRDTRYVLPGTSVLEANHSVIQHGLKERVNHATVVGAVALRDEQAQQFKDANGQFLNTIPSQTIEAFLRPKEQGKGPGLLRKAPRRTVCFEGPVDPCVKILEGQDVPDEEHHDEPPVEEATPDTPAPLTEEGVKLLLGKLLKDMTPPESPTVFKVQSPMDIAPGIEQVHKGVTGFSLESGPADAPSLHDFHHLQIAFEHIWQEIFHDNLALVGRDLYAKLVELGINPDEIIVDSNSAPPPSNTGIADPPADVVATFDITIQQWTALTDGHREELKDLAVRIKNLELGVYTETDYSVGIVEVTKTSQSGFTEEAFDTGNEHWLLYYRTHLSFLRRRGARIIAFAAKMLDAPQSFEQYHEILNSLAKIMNEPHYRFSIYAAESVNFGMLATYQQEWVPKGYQVGELVKTVPLAPKEVRRFTKKVAIRKSRAEKEVENNLHSRKTESEEKSRAETEIIQKAQKKTNFKLDAEGSVNIGIADAKASSSFSQDASTESQEVKKEFREAVFKAAEEYKSERTTEINVSSSEETNFEESGEISNPNDEIPVTYLFYQLQRRFKISEKIRRVTPIILVAPQDFPNPYDIDEDWILRHDWILRRVILDDSFVPAMNYVASKVVGDEVALQEMFKNVELQRRIVDELKEEVVELRDQAGSRYAALESSIKARADAIQQEDDGGGIIPMPVGFIFGGTDAPSAEAMQVREGAAKDAYERAARQEKELQTRLERETTALGTLTEKYTKELSDHLNRKTQIARLRVHLKANIMYYMQAIWSHEPQDQRFFRLHKIRVPKLNGKMNYWLENDPDGVAMPPDFAKPYKVKAACYIEPDSIEYQNLEEVADLDNLLGFKGNYMIFPLKQSNALTDFMMIPYLDPVFGLRDPDPLGNWTLTSFVEYVCCLRKTLAKEKFLERLPGLMKVYQQLMNAPGTDGEEIVVPTDSLYIEALPGVHPILEDFKLMHRAVDVKKAQAEVRAIEFENIRAAARLLAGQREDPTIEKKVVIEGGSSVVAPSENE
jgi:hypothetical protein